MPELPEVETMVRGVRPDCVDRTVVSVEFPPIQKRPISVRPSRPQLTRSVTGKTVTSVSRLAKRILLQLENDFTVVIEPRMTGLLLVSSPPTREHRRMVWHFAPQRNRASTLEFWDRRGLGTVTLMTAENLAQLVAQFGPDALTIEESRLYSLLHPVHRPIKIALLDQHLIAGIGNLYASEILHRSGVSPLRKASSLTRSRVSLIAAATREILSEAIRYEGSTLNDGTYRNALNQDGSYQNHHRVYQRAGDACPDCGLGTIRRIVQAQRATFYCPKCQK